MKILIILLLSINTVYASNYTEVSRCFFIYAGIFEAAKETLNNPVFIYAQKRIAWATGYVQANKNNSTFIKVFDNNLTENKKSAAHIKSLMKNALHNKDVSLYKQAMNVARSCDKAIGLPSSDLPPP